VSPLLHRYACKAVPKQWKDLI